MKTVIYITLTIVYLVFAPFYVSTTYYDNAMSKYPKIDSHAYIWVKTHEKFTYFLLGGYSKLELTGKCFFELYNEGKSYDSIIITEAHIIVQNKKIEINELIGKSYDLDKSIHNMHAGDGSSVDFNFSLPSEDLSNFKIYIVGNLIGKNESPQRIKYTKNMIQKHKKGFVPFWRFVYWELTST